MREPLDRDLQRQKVYDAEWALRRILDTALESGNPVAEIHGVTLTLPPEARFADLASIQDYCDKVIDISRRHLPERAIERVRVRERKGNKFAHYERGGVIAIPTELGSWALRETIILHELAHHLSPGHLHGPVYASAYIALLGTVMAPEMALAQRILYDNGEVTVG